MNEVKQETLLCICRWLLPLHQTDRSKTVRRWRKRESRISSLTHRRPSHQAASELNFNLTHQEQPSSSGPILRRLLLYLSPLKVSPKREKKSNTERRGNQRNARLPANVASLTSRLTACRSRLRINLEPRLITPAVYGD